MNYPYLLVDDKLYRLINSNFPKKKTVYQEVKPPLIVRVIKKLWELIKL